MMMCRFTCVQSASCVPPARSLQLQVRARSREMFFCPSIIITICNRASCSSDCHGCPSRWCSGRYNHSGRIDRSRIHCYCAHPTPLSNFEPNVGSNFTFQIPGCLNPVNIQPPISSLVVAVAAAASPSSSPVTVALGAQFTFPRIVIGDANRPSPFTLHPSPFTLHPSPFTFPRHHLRRRHRTHSHNIFVHTPQLHHHR
jgi:hypothetical protein